MMNIGKFKNLKKKSLTVGLGVMLMFNSMVMAQDVAPDSNLVAQADSTPPSDVENVKAVAGSGSVTLGWDAATDNVGVKGYKIYYGLNSVTIDGGSYTNGPIDVGNKVSYELTGLEGGKKYYFAVTAYDITGNESESYSVEVSATPTGGASSSSEAPKVVSAKANDKGSVTVTFSKEVVLPSVNPESAFTIKTDPGNMVLAVMGASMDLSDPSGKTVLLKTADQTENTNYVLTAGIQIKDKNDVPIVSGTSDTAGFKGSGVELKPVGEEKKTDTTVGANDSADKTAPSYVEVKSLDGKNLQITFSEEVVLAADPRENFIITEAQNTNNIVAVNKVTVSSDGKVVVLETAGLKEMDYNLISVEVADKAGNKMGFEGNATIFKGMKSDEGVNNPPVVNEKMDDAAKDFMAKAIEKMIELTWAKNVNVQNLAGFVLYVSKDMGKTYDNGLNLPNSALGYQLNNLQPGRYFFKLTSKNEAGVESTGVVTSVELPGTGPELGVLLLGSMGLGKLMSRRKKK